MKRIALFYCIMSCCVIADAQVKLPAFIKDSMILQRDVTSNIWGWAAAKEKVTVLFNKKKYSTRTGTDGKWNIQLPASKAGGPYNIDIIASNKIQIKEVLFGDVWFCSGQSNMVHQLNIHDVTYAADIQSANYPAIRQFLVPTLTNLQEPQNDIPAGEWRSAVGNNVRPFSAVAYFFAKKLYDQYHVPIGIINASVGGTPIEAWLSEAGANNFNSILANIQKNKDTAYSNSFNRSATNSSSPFILPDEGLSSNPKWFENNYQPTQWRNIFIPGFWEDQGINNLNGVVWYRREINIPASMTGKAAKVFLGRIVDADELYINGKKIGSTGYQYPQRRYSVPENILVPGKNIFVIRVTNNNGKGGFVPDKPYSIFSGKDTIDLTGKWQYKVGQVFPLGNTNPPNFSAQNQPAALYNAMVAPFIHYNIKGVLWYQGESNAGRAVEYKKLLPALIQDWRAQWQQQSLPFLYVQLPGFMEYNYWPSESGWAMMREAQLQTLRVPHTGMGVAIDLGEWNDIHPDNKKDVGERLALLALDKVYQQKLVSSGPIYESAAIKDNKIIIRFNNIGTGLVSKDGEALKEFAIAGADKKFVWAKAIIDNDKVIVWHDAIVTPMYVRYAWADNPVQPNLYNKEGLPASPFRTDEQLN